MVHFCYSLSTFNPLTFPAVSPPVFVFSVTLPKSVNMLDEISHLACIQSSAIVRPSESPADASTAIFYDLCCTAIKQISNKIQLFRKKKEKNTSQECVQIQRRVRSGLYNKIISSYSKHLFHLLVTRSLYICVSFSLIYLYFRPFPFF